MNLNFEQRMQSVSDEELLKIVTIDRDDYQEAAILAAENELSKRNLTDDQKVTINQRNSVQQKIKEDKANESLELPLKILVALFPGILQLLISGMLKSKGYDRKAKELTKWTLIGLGVYITLIILANLLN